MGEASAASARLDRALVDRALARSRGHARDLVQAGRVRLDGAVVHKPSHPVRPEDQLSVAGADGPTWVGRAAEKLSAALDEWEADGLRVAGAMCVDVGASTGGFTQVLLHRGARSVVAIDVGSGQLVPDLQRDPRVSELSNRHVLSVQPHEVGAPVALIVVDLSFISVCAVLGHIAAWSAADGDVVVLVKPQFEVGQSGLSRRGIVRSAVRRSEAVHRVVDTAYDVGLALRAVLDSPITGTHGNREYLLRLSPVREGMMERAGAHRLADTLT